MDTIIISITDACPLKCFSCYATKDKPLMKLGDFKIAIDKIDKSIKSITITGGEPFSHPDVVEMVKYCAENLRKPRIVTSGYMNVELLKKMRDKLELLTVTVKYPNKHDSAWKRGTKTFDKATEFLTEGYLCGVPLSINWIADKENREYFYQMWKFASEYNAHLQVVRFIPYHNSLVFLNLSDWEWEDLCKHANKFSNVHIAFPSSHTYMDCTGGIARLYIRTDGSVTPCIYLSEAIGNIFEEDFSRLLDEGECWRRLHGRIKGCPGYLKATGAFPPVKELMKDKKLVNSVIKQMRAGI